MLYDIDWVRDVSRSRAITGTKATSRADIGFILRGNIDEHTLPSTAVAVNFSDVARAALSLYDAGGDSNVTGQSGAQLWPCVQKIQLIEQAVGSFLGEITRVCGGRGLCVPRP
jgi:hypothetical protein